MTFFVWGPQWGYSWPVRVVRGHDEYRHVTIGLVTWIGSAFIGWRCRDPECPCVEEPAPWTR